MPASIVRAVVAISTAISVSAIDSPRLLRSLEKHFLSIVCLIDCLPPCLLLNRLNLNRQYLILPYLILLYLF